MKKFFSFLLTLIIVFSAGFFTSCKVGNAWKGWFSYSTLSSTGLTDLPRPNFEYKDSTVIERSVLGNIEKEEFDRYANEVFEYLIDKYPCVGQSGRQTSSFFGGAGDFIFVECEQKLASFGGTNEKGYANYFFVFFEEEPTVGSRTNNVIRLSYYPKYVHRGEDSEVYYNFSITLKNGGMTDKYFYTETESFDKYVSFYSDCKDGEEKSGDQVKIFREKKDLDDYLIEHDLSEYISQYSYSNQFFVAIELKVRDSKVIYYVDSIERQEGKWLFNINKEYFYEEPKEGLQKCVMIVVLDDYVKIENSEDIIIGFMNDY